MKDMKNVKIFLTCLVVFAILGFSGDYDVENLLYRAIVVGIIAATLIFSRREVFHLWWKFCIVFLVLAAAFLFFMSRGDVLGVGARMTINILIIPLFLLLSLGIIGWKSWKLRKK
ncbi:hypothetical protein L0Y49_02445 [bacterium]|nr:hypothetical protein [bacterium]